MLKGFLRGLLKLIIVLVVIAIIAVAGLWLYLKFSPQTGATPSDDQLTTYESLENHDGDHFINLVVADDPEIPSDSRRRDKWKRLWEVITRSAEQVKPPAPLGANSVDFEQAIGANLSDTSNQIRVTWLGHSAALASMDGVSLLFDPMFGKYASPIPGVIERFAGSLPDNIEQMPPVDVVMISHDHYDHLDYGSIKRFDSRIAHYVVPLGVGDHLREWGVDPNKITELNWWDQVQIKGVDIVLTPSLHSSGRTIGNQKSTLWGGFAVLGQTQKLFFSGDTGYGGHFARIGERLGPFDLALVEDGQYNELWLKHHMLPEQSYQAAVDLKAKQMLPIHWGGFVLSTHPWNQPPERLIAAREKVLLEQAASGDSLPEIITPEIGRTFKVPAEKPQNRWWLKLTVPDLIETES